MIRIFLDPVIFAIKNNKYAIHFATTPWRDVTEIRSLIGYGKKQDIDQFKRMWPNLISPGPLLQRISKLHTFFIRNKFIKNRRG